MKRHPITLIIFLILSLIIFSTAVSAWDNCPFGEVNETFPGTCGRYIDTDQDNICDLSQTSPEERQQTKEQEKNTQQQNSSLTSQKNTSKTAGITYNFIPILLLLSIFYATTYILDSKKKLLSKQHRKIWNVVLLITFLVSASFGLLLAISISSGIRLSFYADLLFWHVEFGIAMAIISLIHIAWHWNYYKKIFIKK